MALLTGWTLCALENQCGDLFLVSEHANLFLFSLLYVAIVSRCPADGLCTLVGGEPMW